MKQLISGNSVRNFITILMLSLIQTALWAQENGGSGTTSSGGSTTSTKTSVTTTSDTWYAQPWVWVVGAAVFIIILVAIIRGNSNK